MDKEVFLQIMNLPIAKHRMREISDKLTQNTKGKVSRMSLDVYLEFSGKTNENFEPKIYIREEWYRLHPGTDPVMVGPMDEEDTTVYSANIAHNLGKMAREAGLYQYLWRPEEIGIKTAKELIKPLATGLNELISDPEKYKKFNPENRWGNYEGLVRFTKEYLEACQKWPDANVRVRR